MTARLKKDDLVVFISGKNARSGNTPAKRGRVVRFIKETNRVIVDGANLVKRHTKPTPKNSRGGILDKPMAVHASTVMLIDPSTDKPTRVRMGKDKDGKTVRLATKSGKPIES